MSTPDLSLNVDNCDYRLKLREANPPTYPPQQIHHAAALPPMKFWRGVRWTPPLEVHNCKCGLRSLQSVHRLCSHGFSRSILHPEFCNDCDRYLVSSVPMATYAPRRIYAPKSPSPVDDFAIRAPDTPHPEIGLSVPATPSRHENPGFLVVMANDHYRGLRGLAKRTKPKKPRKNELLQLIEFQRAFRDMPVSPYAQWVGVIGDPHLDSE